MFLITHTHTHTHHLNHTAVPPDPNTAQLRVICSDNIWLESIWQSQRILAPETEVQAKLFPISFQVLVYTDPVVQKTKGSALVTDGKSVLDSHISSTASCSPFSCCTIQPTLLLKRRDRLPFWELLPWADLSFFKRRLFLLHIPRMSQILSVPSWEAV